MISERVTTGPERAHFLLVYAAGFLQEKYTKPLVGVVSAYSEVFRTYTFG